MTPYTQQDIAALKERRKLSKITARELYETAGLRCTQYMAIEGGHILPTDQEWQAIADAFHAIDQKRAFDAGNWLLGKWLLTGTQDQTDATRKLARWNAAVKGKGQS